MTYIFQFLSSSLEAFSICCVLSLLRKEYWQPVKILIMMGVVAEVTALLDKAEVDINLGINILLIVVILKLLYNVKVLEALFDALCSTMPVIIIEMFTTYLVCIYKPAYFEEELNTLIYLTVLTAFFLIVLKIGWKKRIIQTYYKKYQKGIWIVCLNFLFIQIAEMYNWNKTGTIDISITVLVLITVSANLVLAFKLIKNQQQKEELQNQRKLMELKEEFLQQMAAEQHDFAKHLQAIQSILEECEDLDQVQLARAYVSDLVKTRHRKQTAIYVGDGVLSAYLNGKREEAAERNINFSILVKNPIPEFPCSQSDLIEIAGNLIDNAFEAVEELNQESKKVFFEIGTENDSTFLRTMNNLPEELTDPGKMLTKGFSTKKGNLRGYGLPNVKTLTEKYNGKIEIKMNEEVIIVKVLFK